MSKGGLIAIEDLEIHSSGDDENSETDVIDELTSDAATKREQKYLKISQHARKENNFIKKINKQYEEHEKQNRAHYMSKKEDDSPNKFFYKYVTDENEKAIENNEAASRAVTPSNFKTFYSQNMHSRSFATFE